jgi:hypothetical protein
MSAHHVIPFSKNSKKYKPIHSDRKQITDTQRQRDGDWEEAEGRNYKGHKRPLWWGGPR